MKCSDEPSSNALADCGNSYCETCYPDDKLRSTMKDLLEANKVLQERISKLVGVREKLEKSEVKVEELKEALIWVGSSAVAGDSAEQVKASIRKAAVEAIVKADKEGSDRETSEEEDEDE